MLLTSILTREGLLMVTGDESLLLRNVVELLRLPELLLRLLRLSDLLLRLLRLSEWLLRLCQPLRRSLADLGRAVGGLVLLVGQETLLAVDLLLLGDVDQLGLAVSHRNLPEIFDNINIWSNVVLMFHSPALLPLDVLALGLGLGPAVRGVLHLKILGLI